MCGRAFLHVLACFTDAVRHAVYRSAQVRLGEEGGGLWGPLLYFARLVRRVATSALQGSTVQRQASEKERSKDLPTYKDNDFVGEGCHLFLPEDAKDKLNLMMEADTQVGYCLLSPVLFSVVAVQWRWRWQGGGGRNFLQSSSIRPPPSPCDFFMSNQIYFAPYIVCYVPQCGCTAPAIVSS